MQERKRLEQAIADEAEVSRLTSDLDTLFELAREGENVTADLDREMQSFSARSGSARNRDAALRRQRRAKAPS